LYNLNVNVKYTHFLEEKKSCREMRLREKKYPAAHLGGKKISCPEKNNLADQKSPPPPTVK